MTDMFVAPSAELLTGSARTLLEDLEQNRFLFGTVLPTVNINDIDYRFNRGGAALVDAAEFRAYDAESQIGNRRSVVQVQGELPPISRKIRLGEYARLRQRKAEEDEYTAAILNDADTMVTAVAARLELARSEALYSGKLILAENGVTATIDYGRTGSHAQSAPTVWSNTSTAKPITDLLSARDKIEAAGGIAEAIWMNSSVYAEMIATDQVKNLATASGVTPSIVSRSAVSNVLAAFGLPDIKIYSAVVSVAGVTTKVLGDDKVIMTGAGAVGSTLSGMTAEQLEFGSEVKVAGPGIVATSWKKPDPVSVWTKAAAIALPVLTSPDFTVGIAV